MANQNDGEVTADNLSGLDDVRTRVERMIFDAAEDHEHLDADALHIMTMYVAGSVGAGQGGHGSDLDLVVMLRYDGDASGHYDWQEYVQNDIEETLKANRVSLAAPLPPYIGYVDPTLGNQLDCEEFVRNMTRHGDYDRFYDLYDGGFISSGRL